LRRTDEDLVALREALGVSGRHYHGDLDTYIACDLVFHRRLVDAAHNPTLSELYRYFSSVVGAQLRHCLNITPRRQEVFRPAHRVARCGRATRSGTSQSPVEAVDQ
jgi:DNA-binding FadR family transcriptional regulator